MNGKESISQIQLQELVFDYKSAYLYFGIANYNEALHWLNKIMLLSDSRTDVEFWSRILMLIIRFEKGDYDTIPVLIKSTHRYFHESNRSYRFEITLLDFLKKHSTKKSDLKELETDLIFLKKELEKILENPYEKQAMEYFDFIPWIESKLERKTLAEVIRKKPK